jgi:RNA polymerase sigma factor (sigma-70 family)
MYESGLDPVIERIEARQDRGGGVVEKSGTHPAIRELGTLFNAGAVGMLSDGQLLDWFVERREASAFEAIVERFGPLVWGVCRRLLPDHHDAEDAFQATFLVLARRAASIMPREKLGNCLYRVAFQTSMKAMAIRAKRRVRERQAWELTEPEAVRDEHLDEPASGVVQPIVLPRGGVVGLRLEGPKITRVAVYNIESGKWSPLDLDEPASGVVEPMALGPGASAYQVGRFVNVYRSKTSTWDRLDGGADDKQDARASKGR